MGLSPVNAGWQRLQVSTRIRDRVARVCHELPQAHRTELAMYFGWILALISRLS